MVRMKRPWRKNVLWLVGFGYLATMTVYFVLIFGVNMTADAAYQMVQGPLMTLIGGSLAIAKDLLQLDQSDEAKEIRSTDSTGEDQSTQ